MQWKIWVSVSARARLFKNFDVVDESSILHSTTRLRVFPKIPQIITIGQRKHHMTILVSGIEFRLLMSCADVEFSAPNTDTLSARVSKAWKEKKLHKITLPFKTLLCTSVVGKGWLGDGRGEGACDLEKSKGNGCNWIGRYAIFGVKRLRKKIWRDWKAILGVLIWKKIVCWGCFKEN